VYNETLSVGADDLSRRIVSIIRDASRGNACDRFDARTSMNDAQIYDRITISL